MRHTHAHFNAQVKIHTPCTIWWCPSNSRCEIMTRQAQRGKFILELSAGNLLTFAPTSLNGGVQRDGVINTDNSWATAAIQVDDLSAKRVWRENDTKWRWQSPRSYNHLGMYILPIYEVYGVLLYAVWYMVYTIYGVKPPLAEWIPTLRWSRFGARCHIWIFSGLSTWVRKSRDFNIWNSLVVI